MAMAFAVAVTSSAVAERGAVSTSVRELLPYETVYYEIQLPADQAEVLRDIGFDRFTQQMENGEVVRALDEAWLTALRIPALRAEPAFNLLIAEMYFRLGVNRPAIQFELAKPMYEKLMRRHPRWVNQPLVAFRLATIYDRQGFASDALAHYGLLIEWYPGDPIADAARLGMVMSSLRDGRLGDTEQQAVAILETSHDAQIRYHATLGLAVAHQRQRQYQVATDDFNGVVNWPEDLTLLEDFEMFAFADALRETGDYVRARRALLTFIERFPLADDRPLAIYDLAEIAREQHRFEEAVTGYQYLIENAPDRRPGTEAKMILARLRLAAFDQAKDEIAEQLLLQVREQNYYFDLNQKATLDLARYYLRTGKPLATISLAGEVFDNPLDITLATQAISLVADAFNRIVASYPDNPLLVTKVFNRYRKYLSAPSLPAPTYEKLGRILYENLQPDTLTELATNSPLGARFPRRSAFFAALAERLRGNPAGAAAHLRRLLAMKTETPAKAKKAKGKAATHQRDPLNFEARLLLSRMEFESGRIREALVQVKRARESAGDNLQTGRAELATGIYLMAGKAPASAVAHFHRASELLGEVTDAQPLAYWQQRAAFGWADALFQAGDRSAAKPAFQAVLERKPPAPAAGMARLRLAQIARAAGEEIPLSQVEKVEENPEFWVESDITMEKHYRWLQENEKRFNDMPLWERLL